MKNSVIESHNELQVTEFPQKSKLYLFVKRFQDIVLSLLALIVLSPLMLIVALIIFLDDPSGSPFYTQIRIGKDGKEFRFYKFRTMYVDAERKLEQVLSKNESDGPVFKIKDDPRITRAGKFLRRMSIDELPQFLNVLKGDMSIVGPRPPLPREVAEYTPYHAQRLSIIPGITCFWQVMPGRYNVSFDEWVSLDIKYINERSFLTDWKIIFKTFAAVLKSSGE